MNEENKWRVRSKPYWFPAKTYGWGWGSPTTWQGWAVIGAFTTLLLFGAVFIDPRLHVVGFLLYTTVVSGLFVYICWRTGEPPRWRWGKNG
jgi:hypothetical protein